LLTIVAQRIEKKKKKSWANACFSHFGDREKKLNQKGRRKKKEKKGLYILML